MKGPFPTSGWVGGPTWRLLRRLVQAVALVALIVGPLLGGWQRLDRMEMAAWDSEGFDLPAWVQRWLPLGSAPARAHQANQLRGGGIALDLWSVAGVDPAAGTAALLFSEVNLRALIAVALPMLLALIAGRVFCGWMCPFGVLARLYDNLLALLPFRHRMAVPARRPLRWLLLVAGLLAGLLGVHLVLYLALPYLLVQQSVYAAWLLGGGSAVLGVLVGLLIAAGYFGPTAYCASLCPTGAVLSLFGRFRRLRVTLEAPKTCSASCGLCSSACWLQLDPASGDPGPDCDACARCFTACPRANLIATVGGPRRRLPIVTAALLLLSVAGSSSVIEARGEDKPTLILDVERRVDDVTLALSVVDLAGVDLNRDARAPQTGVELSLFLVRGPRPRPDSRGLLASRDPYAGPLTVEVEHGDRRVKIPFAAPNAPASTPRRTLYRSRLPFSLEPNDRVRVLPVAGWLPQSADFEVPRRGNTPGIPDLLVFVLVGWLLAGGLLSLALAVPDARAIARRPLRPRNSTP